MKYSFWLLDLNQQIYNGKSSIWMWGISQEGKRLLVIDTEFQPYFYLELRSNQDSQQVKQNLLENKLHPAIVSGTIVNKKILSVEKQLLKVACNDPFAVEKAARQALKKLDAMNIYESDLRQAVKYQNEYGIQPCKWYFVEIDHELPDAAEYSVDVAGIIHRPPDRRADLDDIPHVRFFAFQILPVSRLGLPVAARDPVYAIAWRTNDGGNGILEKAPDTSDRDLLLEFVGRVNEANPDFILRFDGNTVQWQYLEKRALETGVQLKIGRQQGTPHQSLYGHYSVTGRANIDLADFAKFIHEVKNKKLQNMAAYFGISSGAETDRIAETEYSEAFANQNRRKKLIDQLSQDTEMVLGLGNEAITYVSQVSALSGLPPDQAIAAGVGFRVDSYLMMEAHAEQQVIPTRTEQSAATYKGALVIEPKTGLYEDVALLDFSSMYPNLMIKYNISPDTLVSKHGSEETNHFYEIPEIHHRFRTSPRGFYTVALEKLLEARKITKAQLGLTDSNDREFRLLKARDEAIKVTTNAVYGYAGWSGARWYSREVAESASALGRDTITRSISIAEQLGLEVLYSDTDSLFVRHDMNKVTEFLERIKEVLGLEIGLSEIYKRILFTGAKKKYAGLRADGEIDIVGLEAIRGDWSNLAKNVQNDVLRIILEGASAAEAENYVSKLVRNLKTGSDLPLPSLVIWKTLTRPVAKYEVNAPHVEAAKKMLKDGWPVSVGDKIGFIITKRTGKLYQKAEPYYKVRPHEVDYDYYIRNQLVPAAARVTEILGVTEDKLLRLIEEDSQISLSVGGTESS